MIGGNGQSNLVFFMSSKNKTRHPLHILIDLYAAFLIAYAGIRLLSGGRLWVVEMVSTMAHWLFLGAVLLVPVAVWRRRWTTLALLAVSGLVFIGLYGELFLPRLKRQPACQSQNNSGVRVMTFNISNGLAASDDLVRVLRKSGADVIGIQELPSGQEAKLEAELRNEYPHQIFLSEGFSGIGVLSRHPITEQVGFWIASDRPYLDVRLDVNGNPLRIIVAHPHVHFGPGAPAAIQAKMSALADLINRGESTILMGDFNFTDQNGGYRSLVEAGFLDVHRAVGWGFGSTYPERRWSGDGWLPLVRIDHIFVSDDICPRRVWLGRDGGSDHLPVMTDLSW